MHASGTYMYAFLVGNFWVEPSFSLHLRLCQVLAADPNNTKALFRRGTACVHLNRYEDAEKDLKRAEGLSPTG